MIHKLGFQRVHRREDSVITSVNPYQILCWQSNRGNDMSVNLRLRIWDNPLQIFPKKPKRFFIFGENI